MSAPNPSQTPPGDAEKRPFSPALGGMNPLGLLDGVIGGSGSDWEPPTAEHLEPWFAGYSNFVYIDRGGMGAVYSATQKSLDRRVAIKILPPELGQDRDFVERFHQEARLLAKLQHPYIVAIHDFGTTQVGHLFIVMEYVQGTSVQEIMKKEKPSVLRSLQIIAQVCDALQFAHDHNVVHRDIKPTNILLDTWGRVRVADFGLAKLVESSLAQPTTTAHHTGKMMGTPGYVSPEQRRQDANVDHRSDIFSLGVTLYEMLTGHLPVGVFEKPSRKSEASAAVDRVVMRALHERPILRFQSAAQMKKVITAITTKLEAPSIPKQILQRPITAVVIGIQLLVTGWLLVDKFERVPILSASTIEGGNSPSIVVLNSEFAILPEPLSWVDAQRPVTYKGHTFEVAEIHSDAERLKVSELLQQRGVRTPLWIAAYQSEPGEPFVWASGKPMDYTAWMPSFKKPTVILSEIQAKNERTLRAPSGESPDWVELYNAGPVPVDLSGWKLRHITGGRGVDHHLQQGLAQSFIIQPGAYQLVFCGEGGAKMPDGLWVGFRLEAESGTVRLMDPSGQILETVSYGLDTMAADNSIGCDPDGTHWGVCEAPTPGQPNLPRTRELAKMESIPPQVQAVLLLPEYDARWSAEVQRRRSNVLLRRVKSDS